MFGRVMESGSLSRMPTLAEDKAVVKMGHPAVVGVLGGLLYLKRYDKLCRYVSAAGRAA